MYDYYHCIIYLTTKHIDFVKAQMKKIVVYGESNKLSRASGRSGATCCHPKASISRKHYIWMALAERETMDSMMSSSTRRRLIHINLFPVPEVRRHLCL